MIIVVNLTSIMKLTPNVLTLGKAGFIYMRDESSSKTATIEQCN